MSDKISIIVPIYNVELYLDRCVQSLVNQSYTDLEIILVDDGSTDSCPKICDKWASKDSRIRVIHKENGGLSDARNAGLKIATGEYICFVDSDDIVDSNYTLWLYNAIKDNNVKLSACNLQCFYHEQEVEPVRGRNVIIYTAEEALNQLLCGEKIRAVAWNKMYSKSLLLEESFVKGKHHEDEFFTYRIIDKAKRVTYIDSKLYKYRQRDGSIMNSFSIKRLDALEAYIERLNYIENKYPSLYAKDKGAFCVSCVVFYRTALLQNCSDIKAIKKSIKNFRRQVKFKFRELKNYSFSNIIYIFASKYGLHIFSKILNFRGEIIE